MGSFQFEIPAEFSKQLSQHLDVFDKVAPKMIEAATPILKDSIKKKAPKKSGELIESVGIKKPKKTKTGAYISTVVFEGYDSKTGTPNALKAAVAEFGTSEKDPKPFVRPAVAETEKEITQKMQDVFNAEVER